jgi:hypothetical protein
LGKVIEGAARSLGTSAVEGSADIGVSAVTVDAVDAIEPVDPAEDTLSMIGIEFARGFALIA